MRLSARVDYALRAAICLAAAEDSWTRAEKIADSQDIPLKFLESILLQLRHGGLAESRRGPDGGHRLVKAATEISLADVIRVVDGPLVGVRGQRPENVDYTGPAAALSQVWVALRVNERNILEQVKLADVASGKLPEAITDLLADPSAWTSRAPH